ncbi:hypothetical protein, partial [uncultured Rikenella sp.]|uniref:hypothetical protein n=1 Tax=uncultured Rikenella sp. TaxID=368003 RepID=UPI002611A255
IQTQIMRLNDFLLQRSRASLATGGYCARAAQAPRPVDGKCSRISTGSLYPILCSRACAIQQFRFTAEIIESLLYAGRAISLRGLFSL